MWKDGGDGNQEEQIGSDEEPKRRWEKSGLVRDKPELNWDKSRLRPEVCA